MSEEERQEFDDKLQQSAVLRTWNRITGGGVGPHCDRLVDVSKWQGTIDWAVMSAGIDGVIIKCSQGTWVDSRFIENWSNSAGYNLRRSAYHFFEPDIDPVRQAQFFYDTMMANGGGWTLPLVLDVEKRPAAGGPIPADKVLACLRELERLTGEMPIIYTGVSVWNEMGGLPWASRYPLWVAQYPLKSNGEKYNHWDEVPTGSTPRLPFDWSTWAIWQFSDKGDGKAHGAQSAGLDLNYANGALADLFPLPEPPEPPEPEPPGEDMIEQLTRIADATERIADALEAGGGTTPPPEPPPEEVVTLDVVTTTDKANLRYISGYDGAGKITTAMPEVGPRPPEHRIQVVPQGTRMQVRAQLQIWSGDSPHDPFTTQTGGSRLCEVVLINDQPFEGYYQGVDAEKRTLVREQDINFV